MNVYFSDYFCISPEVLKEHGAFNVSLINDLPLFIDPFLLFNSENPVYQRQHDKIIGYIKFLKDVSSEGPMPEGLLQHWFFFKEVKQNWLGYSKTGNKGSGLARDFASALHTNLANIFRDFGEEKVTRGSHLEKLCLIKDGVGKDSISDFTTNLIKSFLCEYTENFSRQHIEDSRLKTVNVARAEFNYEHRRWQSKSYRLPFIDDDYVLLTPRDILSKDEAWINKHDIIGDFDQIVDAIPNLELRAQINDYLARQIPKKYTQRDVDAAVGRTLRQFPLLIDRYIRFKEDNGDQAVAISDDKVKEVEGLFVSQVSVLINKLREVGDFYSIPGDTFEEASKRVLYLKQVIENNDGYRFFYIKGKPVQRETDLHLLYRLTWYAASDDVNAEVNNGRGPVDYKISRGSKDSTLVEFKLAANSKLKNNLAKQIAVYEKANRTKKSIKVIVYFSGDELTKVLRIIKELALKEGPDLVLIDAQPNKTSASNVRILDKASDFKS
jgi:hypothetical protein